MAARVFLRSFSTNITKYSSNKNAIGGKSLVQGVAVSENGKFIIAWHPDTPFPYECSKPIPTVPVENSVSLVKDAAISTAMRAFKDKHPEVARQELMNLTHTTKHRWFPRSRDKRAKTTPMDRPYL